MTWEVGSYNGLGVQYTGVAMHTCSTLLWCSTVNMRLQCTFRAILAANALSKFLPIHMKECTPLGRYKCAGSHTNMQISKLAQVHAWATKHMNHTRIGGLRGVVLLELLELALNPGHLLLDLCTCNGMVGQVYLQCTLTAKLQIFCKSICLWCINLQLGC